MQGDFALVTVHLLDGLLYFTRNIGQTIDLRAGRAIVNRYWPQDLQTELPYSKIVSILLPPHLHTHVKVSSV